MQALVYSQDIAAIPSVTAKTIIVHLSSLPFYVIRKSPEGLMRFKCHFFTISLYIGYLCFSSHENLTLKEAKNISLFVQR